MQPRGEEKKVRKKAGGGNQIASDVLYYVDTSTIGSRRGGEFQRPAYQYSLARLTKIFETSSIVPSSKRVW